VLLEQPFLSTASPDFRHGKNKGEQGGYEHRQNGHGHEQLRQRERPIPAMG
jgi:hypothetical protein